MTSLLQTVDGDIAIVDGRLKLVTGADEKAQKIKNRLRLFRGEWFLDTRLGTPWYKVVFVKNPDLDLIRRLFRKVILSVEGVSDVQTLDLQWDRAARTLSYSFEAVADDGTPIVGSSEQPFIIKDV